MLAALPLITVAGCVGTPIAAIFHVYNRTNSEKEVAVSIETTDQFFDEEILNEQRTIPPNEEGDFNIPDSDGEEWEIEIIVTDGPSATYSWEQNNRLEVEIYEENIAFEAISR